MCGFSQIRGNRVSLVGGHSNKIVVTWADDVMVILWFLSLISSVSVRSEQLCFTDPYEIYRLGELLAPDLTTVSLGEYDGGV